MRLGVLRSGPLVRANLGVMLFIGSFVAFQFILVLYLQELRGWSALETGLALLVAGVDAVIAPTLTPVLARRFGNVPLILAGMVLAPPPTPRFLRIGEDWAYTLMLPGLVLVGVAFALAYGPMAIAATEGVAEAEQGLAGGLFNASTQFGGALLLAGVTAVNVVVTGDDPTRADLLDGYRAALVVPTLGVLVGAAVTAFGLRRRATAAANPSPRRWPRRCAHHRRRRLSRTQTRLSCGCGRPTTGSARKSAAGRAGVRSGGGRRPSIRAPKATRQRRSTAAGVEPSHPAASWAARPWARATSTWAMSVASPASTPGVDAAADPADDELPHVAPARSLVGAGVEVGERPGEHHLGQHGRCRGRSGGTTSSDRQQVGPRVARWVGSSSKAAPSRRKPSKNTSRTRPALSPNSS